MSTTKRIFLAFLALLVLGSVAGAYKGYTVYAHQKQQLQAASSTIAELSKPQCDQPVATFKAVVVGTPTERVHAGTFEVLTPEAQKGQRVEGFIFHPFEVGDTLTQCVNVVVTKAH